jgi:hypothetical protein
MVEIKTHRDHPASMEQRVTNRLKPSGDTANADVVVKKGDSPNRTITSIHHSGSAKRHGEVHRGEGDITGKPRGVV